MFDILNRPVSQETGKALWTAAFREEQAMICGLPFMYREAADLWGAAFKTTRSFRIMCYIAKCQLRCLLAARRLEKLHG
jgi:hypothetical protein